MYNCKKFPVLIAVSTGDKFSHERSLRICAGSFRIKERKVIQLCSTKLLWI